MTKPANMGIAFALASGLVLAACGKSASDSGGGPAGEVVRVEGTVTAERAGAAPRALAVADAVYADDTVVTGPASAVDIRLAHNQALWQLGADARRRVDASAAWRADKGSAEQSTFGRVDEDRTAAAGRHAEREAMQRSAVPHDREQDDGATKQPQDKGIPDFEDDGLGLGGGGTKGGGFGVGDIGSGTGIGEIGSGAGGGGGGYGSGSGGGRGGGGAKRAVAVKALEVDGGLDKAVVARLLRQRQPALQRCQAHELGRDDTFVADVEVTFTIDPSGGLSPVTVSDVPNGNETLEHCLKAAIRAMTAPSTEGETTVRFRLVFTR